MKNFFTGFLFLILICFGLLYISKYNYILEGVSKIYLKGYTTAYLDDYKNFENREIPVSENPKPWNLHENYNLSEIPKGFESYNKKNGTVAFLIIKNDSILFEKYYNGYGIKSMSNSFSMAKSIVSALLGKSIMQGHVKGLDQKVIDFFPEIKGEFADKLEVGHLSNMSSGMVWKEDYFNPFEVTASAYFVDDISKLILNQPIKYNPGKGFKYKSGATQLLGMVISKATGKNLSEYLYESFWNPMGFENKALWQIDSEKFGMEKAYCCIASNARDFARFGRLYKNFGKWNNKVLLDSTFVIKSLNPVFDKDSEYGFGWWIDNYKNQKILLMRGHLGQYVILLPEKNLIFVRLGQQKEGKKVKKSFTEDIYAYIDFGIEIAKK
tara:strand:- start:334 stop:1479 length:1146 start_codon:yes stop_codon:yes gene_type:complete